MAMKYKKRFKKTEFHSDDVVKRNKLLQLPPHLRGPANNSDGGHSATRMRGYFSKGVTCDPGKTYTEEEKRQFAEDYERRAASA